MVCTNKNSIRTAPFIPPVGAGTTSIPRLGVPGEFLEQPNSEVNFLLATFSEPGNFNKKRTKLRPSLPFETLHIGEHAVCTMAQKDMAPVNRTRRGERALSAIPQRKLRQCSAVKVEHQLQITLR